MNSRNYQSRRRAGRTGEQDRELKRLWNELHQEFRKSGNQRASIRADVKTWFACASVLQLGWRVLADVDESAEVTRAMAATLAKVIQASLGAGAAPIYEQVLALGWDESLDRTPAEFDRDVLGKPEPEVLDALGSHLLAIARAAELLAELDKTRSVAWFEGYLMNWGATAYSDATPAYLNEVVERMKASAGGYRNHV